MTETDYEYTNLRWLYFRSRDGERLENFEYINGPWSLDDYLRLGSAIAVHNAIQRQEVQRDAQSVLLGWFRCNQEPVQSLSELRQALLKLPQRVYWSSTAWDSDTSDVQDCFMAWWEPTSTAQLIQYGQNLHLSLRLHRLASQCKRFGLIVREAQEINEWSDVCLRLRYLISSSAPLDSVLPWMRCEQISMWFHVALMQQWQVFGQ